MKLHVYAQTLKAEAEQIKKENEGLLRAVQTGEERYADALGWHHVKKYAGETQLQALEQLAEKIRKKAEVFVIIGVGGSNNGARAAIEAFAEGKGPKIIYAGNSLAPHAINKVLSEIKGKSVFIDCIAKNFETLEPGVTFRILRQYLEKEYGEEAGKRIITTGTPGSSLEQFSRENGYTFLEFPKDVGGRYSVLTNVGLLPMAVAGIDIRSLVKGAEKMEGELRKEPPQRNIAYQYACMRQCCQRQGYRIEMLSSFEPQLRWFYKWWIQLFAESEGKEEKGIFPASSEFSEELHSMGQYIQEGSKILFETFIKTGPTEAAVQVEQNEKRDGFAYLEGKNFAQINEAAYKATLTAHSRRIPCMELQVEGMNEESMGELFYFFEFACYLSARIQNVNPFDQPGVEAYKKEMFHTLKGA